MLCRFSGRALTALVIAYTSSACVHTARASTLSTTVDVLDFVIGDAAFWPRTGTQFQAQLVEPAHRRVCWVKYARPNAFECWRWDDAWIYHEVDHALDGDRAGASYRFTDGRFLPRRLPVGRTWTLDVRANQIDRFDGSCRAGLRSSFPYRASARVDNVATRIDGELGERRVLMLTYTPYNPGDGPTHPEAFSFAEGAGWFRWAADRGVARFDTVGGPAMTRSTFCTE